MENFLLHALAYLAIVLGASLKQIFILFGPSLVLAFMMHYVSMLVGRSAILLVGPRVYIWVFKILGTPIHEGGHLLFAALFGHRIIDYRLFAPNYHTGSAGYIQHTYNKSSIYQNIGNFFIGIGPILLGAVVVYFSAWALMGEEILQSLSAIEINTETFGSMQSFGGLVENLARSAFSIFAALFRLENLGKWQFWLFLYILVSIGTSITLSPSDIQGAASGFSTIFALTFIFNLLTLWTDTPLFTNAALEISRHFGSFYGLLLFTLFLNLLVGLFLLALTKLFPGLTRRSVRSMLDLFNDY
ncbi:hypothetical protein ACFLYP_00805 [Chloroflexota bacterium]